MRRSSRTPGNSHEFRAPLSRQSLTNRRAQSPTMALMPECICGATASLDTSPIHQWSPNPAVGLDLDGQTKS